MPASSVKSDLSNGAGFERVVSSGRSGVIHFAFHCDADIRPVSQYAGALHSPGWPLSSQTLTCQK